ncbi:MAG TPA: hypothetical protein VF509_05965 [Sphingobium sp.]
MVSRPAFVPALLALLAFVPACSSGADPLGTAEAANAARSRAKWPLPAEPDDGNSVNAVEAAANGAAPANHAEEAASNTILPAAAGAQKLPNDDPAAYRAKGTEPFWSATLVGGTLVLDMPGKPSRYFSVTRSASGGTLRLTGNGVQLSATPGDCDDGMSDRGYGERVQVSLSDAVLKGCGIAGSSIK